MAATTARPQKRAFGVGPLKTPAVGAKIVVWEGERLLEAIRRFRGEVNRSGITRELARQESFEKPSHKRRRRKGRSKLRAQRWNRICGGYVPKKR